MLLQTQTTVSWLTLVGRALVFAVYLVLFLFFRKGYARSKQDGLPNKFLLGYALFFGFMSFYGAMSVLDQSLIVFTDFGGLIGKLDADFSEFYGIPVGYVLIMDSLANPLYLLGMMILTLLLAAQVYPLEMVLGRKRPLATYFLFIAAAAILPAYLPSLCYTVYTDIVAFMVIGGIVLGLVLNIGINCKLAATTTGDLKKRSLSIIFASILFYAGFLMSLKFDAVSILYQLDLVPNMDWDVLVGYGLQAVSSLLYWRGLRSG